MHYDVIKAGIAENFDLPKDVIFNLPSLSIIGNQELTIDNFKSIKEFTDKSITLNTSCGKIILSGKNIKISYLTKETIIINGLFNMLEFRR